MIPAFYLFLSWARPVHRSLAFIFSRVWRTHKKSSVRVELDQDSSSEVSIVQFETVAPSSSQGKKNADAFYDRLSLDGKSQLEEELKRYEQDEVPELVLRTIREFSSKGAEATLIIRTSQSSIE